MKKINKDYIIKDDDGFWIDMVDVISYEVVGWVCNERFEFEFEDMYYSGVVKDSGGGFMEVYLIEDVEEI